MKIMMSMCNSLSALALCACVFFWLTSKKLLLQSDYTGAIQLHGRFQVTSVLCKNAQADASCSLIVTFFIKLTAVPLECRGRCEYFAWVICDILLNSVIERKDILLLQG